MTSAAQIRPRRSVLYMPGANERAMEKARALDCDAIIFDLEDAVAADAKLQARASVRGAIESGGYGHRELVVRVNGVDTPWGAADIDAMAGLPIDALLIPKIENAAQVEDVLVRLADAGAQRLPVWLMIETPRGVLNAAAVAGCSDRVRCLVMGTSDLVKELRASHVEPRVNLAYALQHCVLVARAAGIDVLDGVHLDFRNLDAFERVCAEARAMGFDGKTLIHPTQIGIANEAFGYTAAEVEHARAVLEVWEAARAAGKGVAVLDGRLVENLHAAEARRVLAFAESVSARD